jgi:hypothetical protein
MGSVVLTSSSNSTSAAAAPPRCLREEAATGTAAGTAKICPAAKNPMRPKRMAPTGASFEPTKLTAANEPTTADKAPIAPFTNRPIAERGRSG